jgi:hypothetical protein
MIHPSDWLPLAGVGLLIGTTVVSIAGAYAMGRARGLREGMLQRDELGEDRDRLQAMQRSVETIAEEVERLGEVQRFALKVIAEKAAAAVGEQPRFPSGRVITPH